MIPLWSRILPIRNAKHRQNPVTVRGHGVPVYCNLLLKRFGMDFARNLPCIRREAPGEVPVGVRVLNSYGYFRKVKTAGDGTRIRATAVNGE